MRKFTFAVTFGILVALSAAPASAGWQDWLKEKTKDLGGSGGASSALTRSALSQEEMVSGLKEALSVGVRRAMDILGKQGGFLNDAAVRIPVPESMRKVESGLRSVGQEKLADDFVTTLNQAAEQAVPKGVAIFSDAIGNMSLDDAKAILDGPDDAATKYFQKNTSGPLTDAMLPIVRDATNKVGVTATYKSVMDKAGVLTSLLGQKDPDLDGYVTGKALDGLFLKLAAEEKRIRENPVARSTELLKKVFGATP